MRCEPVEDFARPRAAGLACTVCGCTDDNACPGGCGWVSIDPPLCSACADDDGYLELGSGGFAAERCPASATPALHARIWVDAVSGYCARCRAGFTT